MKAPKIRIDGKVYSVESMTWDNEDVFLVGYTDENDNYQVVMTVERQDFEILED